MNKVMEYTLNVGALARLQEKHFRLVKKGRAVLTVKIHFNCIQRNGNRIRGENGISHAMRQYANDQSIVSCEIALRNGHHYGQQFYSV